MQSKGHLVIDAATVLFWPSEASVDERLEAYVDRLTKDSKQTMPDQGQGCHQALLKEMAEAEDIAALQGYLAGAYPSLDAERVLLDLLKAYRSPKERCARDEGLVLPFMEYFEDDAVLALSEEWTVILYIRAASQKELNLVRCILKAVPGFGKCQCVASDSSLLEVLSPTSDAGRVYVVTADCGYFAGNPTFASLTPRFSLENSLVYYQSYRLGPASHATSIKAFKESGAFWTCFSIANLGAKLGVIEAVNSGVYRLEDLVFVGLFFAPYKLQNALRANMVTDRYPLTFVYHDPLADALPTRLDIVHARLTNVLEAHGVRTMEEADARFREYMDRIAQLEERQGRKVKFINSVRHFKVYASRSGMDEFFASLLNSQEFRQGCEQLKTPYVLRVARSIVVDVNDTSEVG